MEFAGRDCSYAHALSYKEKGNNLSQIRVGSTLLAFNVMQNLTKIDKCKLGFLVGSLENWFY